MGKNLQINKNWIISIITLVCFAAEPVSELIKVSDFVFVDFIEIEKTNQNDILEIDESQFDSKFLNKSRKTIYQSEFNEAKSIRPLSLISYTKVDIEVVIPPPDCIS
jgi:glucose-6-phosphate isomerase